jgi:hypothetical protein
VSKHTLGPWEVRKNEPWVIAKAYGNMKSVVHLNLPIEQSEEQRANARLIAAAPDLLDVAKEANAELERLNDPRGFVSMRQERIMEKARAAIAKATGGEA